MYESKKYLETASLAAKSERQGIFSVATEEWAQAAHFAMTGKNRHWAQCRSEQCAALAGIHEVQCA